MDDCHSTLHTRQSSTQSDKYQVSHRYSCFSWQWAHSCSKHVEKRNKHTKKNCAPSWLYLQDYTGKHGQQNIKCFKSWFNSLHVWFRNYSPDFDKNFFTLSALKVIRHISCWFMPSITSLTCKSVVTGFLKNWATHLTWKIIQTSLGSKTWKWKHFSV